MLINGESYVHSYIRLFIGGTKIEECTSIEFSEKQEKKNNYGTGFKPVSRGRGIIECEGSLTVSMNEVMKLRENAPNKKLLKIAPFSVTVSWSEDGINTITVVLKGCEFTEDKVSSKSNDTTTEIELPLIIAEIEYL